MNWWKLIIPALKIREGDRVPEGYGIAYPANNQYAWICYPIPINIIAGLWKRFVDFVRFPFMKGSVIHEIRKESYRQGWSDGSRSARLMNEEIRQIVKRLCVTSKTKGGDTMTTAPLQEGSYVASSATPLNSPSRLTKGQYLVGVSFNPSNNLDVDTIKAKAADLIDYVERLRFQETFQNDRQSGEIGRCKSLAITNFEQGAMWAVKAATKQP
jgi:hypothetical protein